MSTNFKNRYEKYLEQDIQLLTAYEAGGAYTRMPRVMHMHSEQIEIIYIKKGNGTHIIDGKSYATKEGDILVYNSGVLHDESSASSVGMQVYYCAIKNLKIRNLPTNHLIPQGKESVIPSGEQKETIEFLFRLLCETVQKQQDTANEIGNHLASLLVLMIYELADTLGGEVSKVQQDIGNRIKTYLDIHYMEDINLHQVAAALKISPYYLGHIFKEYQGISPMQYVTRRRIGEAQSLLIHTEKGITQIAITVGYNNSNHFNTVFSKVVGMSPAKYRKYWKKNKE